MTDSGTVTPPADDGWISVETSLPGLDEVGRPATVLAWGCIYNGSRRGSAGYMLATVQVHPNTGAFWRAHGSLADVFWWHPLPAPPAGERPSRPREPATGAF